MLENTPKIQNFIIQNLAKFYGIEADALSNIALGADSNALVYKAESKDKNFFVKIINGTHSSASIDVLELLKNSGLQSIIYPIKTLDGKSLQHTNSYTLIVYPFIEGQDGFSKPLTKKQWQTFGKELRKLHEIKVPDSLQKQLLQETYSAKFRDAVTKLYKNLDTFDTTDTPSRDFINSLKKNSKTIEKQVTRAGELAQKLKNDSAQFVLCHTDIHAGNVMIKDDDIYLVDWDAPMMAPKERDLMFIGGGVGNVWNRPEEEILFYKGYGETEVNHSILSYYRHERIIIDILEFAESILSNTSSQESKVENFNHYKGMFEPNGVVDIAFGKDGN